GETTGAIKQQRPYGDAGPASQGAPKWSEAGSVKRASDIFIVGADIHDAEVTFNADEQARAEQHVVADRGAGQKSLRVRAGGVYAWIEGSIRAAPTVAAAQTPVEPLPQRWLAVGNEWLVEIGRR